MSGDRGKPRITKYVAPGDPRAPKKRSEIIVPVPTTPEEARKKEEELARERVVWLGKRKRGKSFCSWCGKPHYDCYLVQSAKRKLIYAICKFCLSKGGDAQLGAYQGGLPGLGKGQ